MKLVDGKLLLTVVLIGAALSGSGCSTPQTTSPAGSGGGEMVRGTGGAAGAAGGRSPGASGGGGTGGTINPTGSGGTLGSGGARGGGGSSGTGGARGTGGSGGSGVACASGSASTINQVMTTAAIGARVTLTGIVATSAKFLASRGSTGDCQWGLFVSDPVTQAIPYSGALILATGKPAVVDARGGFGPCPVGTDGIAVDAVPGDVFSVNATVRTYVKASCATTATTPPASETRLTDACDVQRTATGHAVPSPATVPPLSELTNGATEAVHKKWTGVLVKLSNVTAMGGVSTSGAIQLTNGLRIRDRIYQGNKSAAFASGTTWSSIVGVSHLDVCTWSLEPRDPCSDFNPKSQNCP